MAGRTEPWAGWYFAGMAGFRAELASCSVFLLAAAYDARPFPIRRLMIALGAQ